MVYLLKMVKSVAFLALPTCRFHRCHGSAWGGARFHRRSVGGRWGRGDSRGLGVGRCSACGAQGTTGSERWDLNPGGLQSNFHCWSFNFKFWRHVEHIPYNVEDGFGTARPVVPFPLSRCRVPVVPLSRSRCPVGRSRWQSESCSLENLCISKAFW